MLSVGFIREKVPRVVLSNLSKIFYLGVQIDKFITKPKKINHVNKTISVGNVLTGGNGKTPLVEYIAAECLRKKKLPLILSRGYGQDERYQYQWNVPRALVGIGTNRVEVANKIVHDNNNNLLNNSGGGKGNLEDIDTRNNIIAILDDGFQTWHVERDVDIVCINCLNPFSNEEILPLGLLREPLTTSLQRATHIILYNSQFVGSHGLNAIINKIKSCIKPDIPMLYANMKPLHLLKLKDECKANNYEKLQLIACNNNNRKKKNGEDVCNVNNDLSMLFDKIDLNVLVNGMPSIYSFSGIANSDGLHKTIETIVGNKNNFEISNNAFIFPDHYNYDTHDVKMMKKQMLNNNNEAIVITTQKDICRVLYSNDHECCKSVFEIMDPYILVSKLEVTTTANVICRNWLDDIILG